MNRRISFPAVRAVNRRKKPVIGASALERLLLRHVDLLGPESRLCVSVIKQVFVDLCGSSHFVRCDAQRFFCDGRLEAWCELVAFTPEFIREIAVKTGYLPVADAPYARNGGDHA